ncbi:hypothetical protein [Microbacterium proteolyticum]
MGSVLMNAPRTVRDTGTWIETTDGWYASTFQIAQDDTPTEFFIYDHEGTGHRQIAPRDVLAVEQVTSEGLYLGHWIPVVSTWSEDMTPLRAPLPFGHAGYLAMLFFDAGPERDAIAALPRAEVHDDRTSNGGISLLVPFAELTDYRETATRLGTPVIRRRDATSSPTE